MASDKNQITVELLGKTTKFRAEFEKSSKSVDKLKRSTKKAEKANQRFRISTAGIRRSLGAVRNNLLLVTFALGGSIAAVSKLISAYAEQELAEKKLSAALGFTSQALLTQASALQQQTAFGDEAIIGVQALIAAFTKDEDKIKELTKATLDLSAAKGMDLTAAADLVSKSFGSATNALSRYGITVEGAVGSTERLEMLTGNVAELFGGQAVAQADTLSGSIDQMKNAIGDTAEAMGEGLAPVIINIARFMKSAAEAASEFFRELTETPLESTIRHLKDLNVQSEGLLALEKLQLSKEISVLNTELVASGGHRMDQESISKRLIQLSDETSAAYEKEGFLVEKGVELYQDQIDKVNTLNTGIKTGNAEQGLNLDIMDRRLGTAGTERKNEELRLDALKRENVELTDAEKLEIKSLENSRKIIEENMNEVEGLETILKIMIDLQQKEELRLGLRKQLKEDDDVPSDEDIEAWEKFLEKQQSIVDTSEEFTLAMAEKHIAYAIEQELLGEWIENNKELAETFGLMTDEQKKAQKDQKIIEKERKKIVQGVAKDSMELGRLAVHDSKEMEKAAVSKIKSFAAAAAARQFEKIIATVPFPANIVAAAIGGFAVSASVEALTSSILKAEHGMDQIVDKPTLILAGEAGAEHVGITPLESPGMDAPEGGGASVVVNVSGNVLTSDFVENELADNIREAVRRGTDFGMG